ncbi:unnamed protein product [Amoebophrya sp. A25]|nr:unnamed protein product [Amoebophrya sp. A25]|eukprot:GSA25T00018421001.1
MTNCYLDSSYLFLYQTMETSDTMSSHIPRLLYSSSKNILL